MLVLTRDVGQSILIDGGITITVLSGGRIGIDAPKGVKILRAELSRDAHGITDQQWSEVYRDYGNPVG